MKIVPRSEAVRPVKPMDAAHFTGPAGSRDLIQASPSTAATSAVVVRFEPGSRNHWHSHSGGQLLHVIEGEGWVQVRGQDPVRLRAEDTVIAEPGEEHWHGAGPRGPMAHIAVVFGDTRWLEPSAEPPE